MNNKTKKVSDEVICGVYGIKNIISKKIYIGSSKNIYRRWLDHMSALKRHSHHSKHLQRSWDEYGESAFIFGIIETCEEYERFDCEQKWMDYYKSYNGQYGYNESLIAKCVCIPRPFTIDNIKNGKSIMSIEDFELVLSYLINTNISIPKIANLTNVPKSTIYSIYFHEEYSSITKDLVFQKRKNKSMAKISEDTVLSIINDLCNMEIPADIARKYNVNPNVIYDIKLHKTWKEYTQDIVFPDISGVHRPSKSRKKVCQYSMDDELLGTFESIMEADASTGVSFKKISACCNGKQKHADGYKWKFADDVKF